MNIIEAKKITREWHSYKTQYNDKERKQDNGNWIGWSFEEDGKAKYLVSTDN